MTEKMHETMKKWTMPNIIQGMKYSSMITTCQIHKSMVNTRPTSKTNNTRNTVNIVDTEATAVTLGTKSCSATAFGYRWF